MFSQTIVQEEKLSGIVERVTFHSLETGWSVLKVSPFKERESIVTVLIHQAKVFAGASMEFRGKWVTHPKFGDQFKASKALEKKPASTAALEKYLGSGLIRGVGSKTAKKIVKHFGERTLNVFENSIGELVEVPSIAEKKLAQIQLSWLEHKSIRDVMMFLQSHGVSTLFAVKIFKQYKEKAIELVKENPYCLARDIYGIGFFSADSIALSLGFEKDGVHRVQAGIKHVLSASREDGHCYLLDSQIIEQTQKLLEVRNEELVRKFLHLLLEEKEIVKRVIEKEGISFDAYYAKSLFWAEESVVSRVKALNETLVKVERKRVKNWIEVYCEKAQMKLSKQQKESICGVVEHSFSILTGGPGCGKTTTTKVLVKLLDAMGKKVTLCAPTGRAAQRMSEVIGKEAKTVHRLLEWEPQKGGFKKGEEDPLRLDFLIIDECSMLDITLASSLLKAVPEKAQVLFIGDPDQLPSVGAGAVLSDLLDCSSVPSFKLTEVFRQAQDSLIIRYAHEMNSGKVPMITSPFHDKDVWEKDVDCLFIDSDEATLEQLRFMRRAKLAIESALETDQSFSLKISRNSNSKEDKKVESDHEFVMKKDEGGEISIEKAELDTADQVLQIPHKFKHVNLREFSKTKSGFDELKEVIKKVHPWSSLHYSMSALDCILRLYTKSIPEKLGQSSEIQILTPQVRGSLGTYSLNQRIQEQINPFRENRLQIKLGDRYFREGDRVIQMRNNYDLNIFNGDIGRIKRIDPETYECEIIFGSKLEVRSVVYSKDLLTELKLAYAITIHKSQGSEFEAVIIPVSSQHFNMLYRNLIYTGLTRAKSLVVFVGSRKALAMAIKNIDNRKRQSAVEFLMNRVDNS